MSDTQHRAAVTELGRMFQALPEPTATALSPGPKSQPFLRFCRAWLRALAGIIEGGILGGYTSDLSGR